MNDYLKLTRTLNALYLAGATVAAIFWDPLKVSAICLGITTVASYLANIMPDNTWPDAVVNGFAINLTLKTTTTPTPVVGQKVG